MHRPVGAAPGRRSGTTGAAPRQPPRRTVPRCGPAAGSSPRRRTGRRPTARRPHPGPPYGRRRRRGGRTRGPAAARWGQRRSACPPVSPRARWTRPSPPSGRTCCESARPGGRSPDAGRAPPGTPRRRRGACAGAAATVGPPRRTRSPREARECSGTGWAGSAPRGGAGCRRRAGRGGRSSGRGLRLWLRRG